MTSPCRCLIVSLLTLALCACGGGAPPNRTDASGPVVWELRLDEGYHETTSPSLFGGGERVTHRELLDRLREARDDDDVKGLLLRIGEFGGAFARAQDIAQAVSAVREAKKPVHCYIETTDNLGYAIAASVCDRISATPGGMLDFVGLASQAIYARQLLQNVGLSAELMQVGRFKGAADPLTRDDMPPEVRENLDALLDDLHGYVIDAVAQGRKLATARVQEIADSGPYTSADAAQAGLIDDVGFDDEARSHAQEAAKVERTRTIELRRKQESVGLLDLLRALSGGGEHDGVSGERLALAFLDGTIMYGSERSIEGAHAVPFVKAMRRFADDDDVRAVVLRIDSPGGSALASDMMWHAVRRVVKRKPVIVSVGDMAASGGYYVASAGTEIIARDNSLIGSIGVVGGKIVGEELLRDKLGVSVVTLQRGKNAGWMSSARRFTPGERAAFEHSLRATYRLFLRRIEQGRAMEQSRIEAVAEGRIMSGRVALDGGLVDKLGGLGDALARAREQGKLAKDSAIEVWPRERTLLEELTQVGTEAETRASLLSRVLAAAGDYRAPLVELLLRDEAGAAAALPFSLVIR